MCTYKRYMRAYIHSLFYANNPKASGERRNILEPIPMQGLKLMGWNNRLLQVVNGTLMITGKQHTQQGFGRLIWKLFSFQILPDYCSHLGEHVSEKQMTQVCGYRRRKKRFLYRRSILNYCSFAPLVLIYIQCIFALMVNAGVGQKFVKRWQSNCHGRNIHL